mgnify:CR=1 FL=1
MGRDVGETHGGMHRRDVLRLLGGAGAASVGVVDGATARDWTTSSGHTGWRMPGHDARNTSHNGTASGPPIGASAARSALTPGEVSGVAADADRL